MRERFIIPAKEDATMAINLGWHNRRSVGIRYRCPVISAPLFHDELLWPCNQTRTFQLGDYTVCYQCRKRLWQRINYGEEIKIIPTCCCWKGLHRTLMVYRNLNTPDPSRRAKPTRLFTVAAECWLATTECFLSRNLEAFDTGGLCGLYGDLNSDDC